MIRRTPRTKRTDTRFPYTTLCQSWRATSSPRPNGLHCGREHVRTAAAPTGPLLRARFALLGSRDRPGEPRMSGHSQFQLLRQRRFLPFFATQCFGAFNDNVYRQAIIGMLFWLGVSAEQKTLYATLAPAIFILPYFLFSRSEEHTSELQSLMRISYAVFCLKKKKTLTKPYTT